MKLSIIIPAYNEEKTIGEILNRVVEQKLPDHEIIVVDDGSKDQTYQIAYNLQKKIRQLSVVKHRLNKGKGRAVATGIKKSKGEVIIIQDADLEYDPRDIARLIKPVLNKKSQVVYGTRLKMKPTLFGKNRTPFLSHFFGNKFLSKITSILYGYGVSDMETGYKVFHRSALRGVKLKSQSFDFEPEITAKILKKQIKIKEIPIKTNPRGYDEGKKIHTVRDGIIALYTLLKYRFTN